MEGDGMGWSEWITLGAAVASSVISILSWRWAKASADAAKQANFLQLHNHRRELYLAFCDLQYRLMLEADNLDIKQVMAFFEHSRTCYLYVSSDLASQMKDFYDRCFKIAEKKGMRRAQLDQIDLLKKDPDSVEYLAGLRAEASASHKEARAMVMAANPIGRAALEALKEEISTYQPKPGLWQKLVAQYRAPFDWGE